MPQGIRFVAILSLLIFITALSSCSGSDSQTSVTTTTDSATTLTTSTYSVKLDNGLVVCSDGTQFTQGYGADVDITVNSPLIIITHGGEQVGVGDISSDGVMHASATISDSGNKYSITLDGQVNGTTINGNAKAMFSPVAGARCALNTSFTATAKEGV